MYVTYLLTHLFAHYSNLTSSHLQRLHIDLANNSITLNHSKPAKIPRLSQQNTQISLKSGNTEMSIELSRPKKKLTLIPSSPQLTSSHPVGSDSPRQLNLTLKPLKPQKPSILDRLEMPSSSSLNSSPNSASTPKTEYSSQQNIGNSAESSTNILPKVGGQKRQREELLTRRFRFNSPSKGEQEVKDTAKQPEVVGNVPKKETSALAPSSSSATSAKKPTNRVKFLNVAKHTNEATLRGLIDPFGAITSIIFYNDKTGKRNAAVTFKSVDSAKELLNYATSATIDGSQVTICFFNWFVEYSLWFLFPFDVLFSLFSSLSFSLLSIFAFFLDLYFKTIFAQNSFIVLSRDLSFSSRASI